MSAPAHLLEAVEAMRDQERQALQKLHRKAGTCYWCAHHSDPKLARWREHNGNLRGALYHQDGGKVEACARTARR